MVLVSPSGSATPPIASPASPRSGRFRRLTSMRSQSHGDSSSRNRNSHHQPVLPSLNSLVQDTVAGLNHTSVTRNALPSPLEQAHSGDSWLPTSLPSTQLQSSAASPLESSPAVDTTNNSRNMTRRRSATTPAALPPTQSHPTPTHGRAGDIRESEPQSPPSASRQATMKPGTSQMPSIRFVNYQDGRASRPSLGFPTISRTLPRPDSIIRVGRYSEKDAPPEVVGDGPSDSPVGFKSKVVSRKHCEFSFKDSHWWIKDTKSSSGTFLNRIRLSQPNIESKPYKLNDGDIVQLGIDFKGGEESMFRCVKIRIYCNKSWQQKKNQFNTSTHKQLQQLTKNQTSKSTDANSRDSTDCTICLCAIAPCQALFIAPCSHTWHYKCIKPIIMRNADYHYPEFLCPNCRAVADLEEDIEETEQWEESEEIDDGGNVGQDEGPEANSVQPAFDQSNDHDTPPQTSEDDDLATEISNIAMRSVPHAQGMPGLEEVGDERDDPMSETSRASSGVLNPDASTFVPSPTVRNGPPQPLGRFSDWQLPGWQFAVSPHTPSKYIPTSSSSERQEEEDTPLTAARTIVSPGSPLPSNRGMPPNEGPLTPRNNAGPFLFDGVEDSARGA